MKPYLNLDLLAATTAIISTISGGLRKRFTWLFSIFSCSVYIIIFYSKGMMYNVGVHLVYLPISIWGALTWGLKKQDDRAIRSLPPRVTQFIVAAIALTLTASLIFATDQLHTLDKITSVLSSIALFLLSNHFLESWLIFFIADILYLKLFLTANFDYSYYKSMFYIVFAMYSFLTWRRKYREKELA